MRPPIPSVEASSDPLHRQPASLGAMVSVNLTLASIGNVVPGSVSLTATAPKGITVTGLTSPLNLALNASITECPLSIGAAAICSPAAVIPLPVSAIYTPAGGTQQFTNSCLLPVTVTALGILRA